MGVGKNAAWFVAGAALSAAIFALPAAWRAMEAEAQPAPIARAWRSESVQIPQPGDRVILGPRIAKDGDSIVAGQMEFRIKGVDAPELRTRCPAERAAAEQARDYLQRRLDRADEVVATIDRHEDDKYGRFLATVSVDGVDLTADLLGNTVSRAYTKGRRGDWCDAAGNLKAD